MSIRIPFFLPAMLPAKMVSRGGFKFYRQYEDMMIYSRCVDPLRLKRWPGRKKAPQSSP